METRSLKTLSALRLRGNQRGNQKETLSFPQVNFKETGKETNTMVIWQNPYLQGTPEARQESLRLIIEAILYGFPSVDDEQTRQINDMARNVLSGKAKLADFRCLLGHLH